MHPTAQERPALLLETPPAKSCKNCGSPLTGRYCNHCGQRADIRRVTWQYIGQEIPQAVWNVDRGIVFTLRELILRPGDTIREFLAGQRVRHYRPLALVLLLSAVLTFILQSLDVQIMRETQAVMGTPSTGSAQMGRFYAELNEAFDTYFNLVQLVFLPVTAFFHWLFFRRKGYNYPEHLVANTFLLNVPFVFLILGILGFKLAGGGHAAFSIMLAISSLITLSYHVWAYVKLFDGRVKRLVTVGRVLAANAVNYLCLVLIFAVLSAAYLVVQIRKNPDAWKADPAAQAPFPQK